MHQAEQAAAAAAVEAAAAATATAPAAVAPTAAVQPAAGASANAAAVPSAPARAAAAAAAGCGDGKYLSHRDHGPHALRRRPVGRPQHPLGVYVRPSRPGLLKLQRHGTLVIVGFRPPNSANTRSPKEVFLHEFGFCSKRLQEVSGASTQAAGGDVPETVNNADGRERISDAYHVKTAHTATAWRIRHRCVAS